MKKSLLVLLASLMAVSATVQATTYTDKTYMNTRPVLNDLATEVSTWHASKALHGENMFGGSVQVAGFYVQSQDRVDAGKYFGTTNSYNSNAVQDFISVGMSPTGIATGDEALTALNSTDIAKGEVGLKATIKLSPRRTVGGARLDYHQKLNNLVEGLWFKVDMPVVSVEHRLDMANTGTNVTGTGANAATGKTALDVLSGNYSTSTAAFQQSALAKAKLIKSRSAAGVADINLQLGYDILREEKYHLGLNAGLTIPTGNKPSGEFLFEPVYGTRHFALGAGFDGCVRIHQDGDFSARIMAVGDYRYQFKAEEIRTAGISKSATDKSRALEFGHYYVLGTNTVSGLQNAANVLTQAMNVTPGSQFEGLLGLGVNWGNVVLDLGYNLYYRTDEEVSLKTAWTDGKYGFVDHTDSAAAWAIADTTRGINAADIYLPACTTPSLVSHKVYGGVGYIFKDMETPVHLGLGGFYEFKGDNAALSNWAISGKLGVAF